MLFKVRSDFLIAFADSLRWTEEVAPPVRIICATFHPNIRDAFGPVENALQESFLHFLFQGVGEEITGRGFTRVPLNQVVLGLPDPTKAASDNWKESFVITGHSVAAPRCSEEFRTDNHAEILR